MVWDFDWSLVNENSDTFVLRELAPALTDEMKQLQAERPAIFGKGKWTALMDHLLTKLGEEHMVSRRQIEHCLEGIPVFVETSRSSGSLQGGAASSASLSDANSVFIDEVLRAACFQRHFSAVATNFGRGSPTRARTTTTTRRTTTTSCGSRRTSRATGPTVPALPREPLQGRRPRPVARRAAAAQGRLRRRRVRGLRPCLRLRAGGDGLARGAAPLAKKLEAMKDDAKVADARVAYWEDGAELARALRAAANFARRARRFLPFFFGAFFGVIRSRRAGSG